MRTEHETTLISATLFLLLSIVNGAAADPVGLSIVVNDENGDRLPARVHLFDSKGQPQRSDNLPFWRDHFVCPGQAELQLMPDTYRYAIERGPEYTRAVGQHVVDARSAATLTVQLQRVANLRADGWYSGDLHVHRAPRDIELLMLAEDLDFAPVITWWNERNLWAGRELPSQPMRRFDGQRFYSLMAGEDERGGGALLFFGLQKPLKIDHATREVPSPMQFVELARRENPRVWVDIEKPFWWDVPIWLASGTANSIGLANNHMNRRAMYMDEAWGKPRDVDRLPNPRGNGYWTQEIYYHALNCGIRIPPSAGSASGVLPNPVGYNRVYVYLGGPLDPNRWWERLAAGQCFVTNGPLLICRANGQLPGTVFRTQDAVQLQLEIELTSLDSVPAIEVIKNGTVVKRIPCQPRTTQTVSCEVDFSQSGWFLVRAITGRPETFRFASTGPFYVQRENAPAPIDRASAQFFLDWVDERIDRLKAELPDNDERDKVLSYHERGRRFWASKVENAELSTERKIGDGR